MKYQQLLSRLAVTLGLLLTVAFAAPLPGKAFADSNAWICYNAYVQKYGWNIPGNPSNPCNGDTAGTIGQSLRMEAITIRTSYNVCYRAWIQNIGWTNNGRYLCNDAVVGTTGQSLRMEAIQITYSSPKSNQHVCYRAHVQNIGWQNTVCDGAIAGTMNQSLRMEAIQIWIQ